MKNYILCCVAVLGMTTATFIVWADEEEALSLEQQAALLNSEVAAAKAAEAKPRWKSSVGDIERTASSLMEANNKLSSEYRRLSEQIAATEDAIQAQKELGKAHSAALQQRKMDIETPQDTLIAKTGLLEVERSIAQKRMDLSVMQTKLHGLDNKLNLRKLKLSDLSLQQKTQEVERKAKEEWTGSSLRDEIAVLTRQVESQAEQEKIISQKLAGLQQDQCPFIGEARAVSSEIAVLKQRLSEAAAQEQTLTDQLASVQAQKTRLGNDKAVLRYKTLREEKESLSSRVAQIAGQIREAEKVQASARKEADDLRAEQVSLEKQNKAVSSEMDDLRENIAVLEYKISSLERYQDRNRNTGR